MFYNVQKMIDTGKKILQRNQRRDITTHELMELAHRSNDRIDIAGDSYYFGVAVGMRIAKAEADKTTKK